MRKLPSSPPPSFSLFPEKNDTSLLHIKMHLWIMNVHHNVSLFLTMILKKQRKTILAMNNSSPRRLNASIKFQRIQNKSPVEAQFEVTRTTIFNLLIKLTKQPVFYLFKNHRKKNVHILSATA